MTASLPPAPLVFGLVVLDLQRRELTRKGRARHLRATSFDVLAYLASNAGRNISRDELAAAIWPGRQVTDDTIRQCVAEVRQALQPEADVVRILPGEGYRFEADIRRADPGTDPYGEFVEDPERTSAAPPRRTLPSTPGWRPPRAVWLTAAVLALAAGGWLASTGSPSGERSPDLAASEPAVAPQVTVNTSVVQLMVTGNDAAAKHSVTELQRARAAYEQAVKADPRYAPAYGALASTLAELAALAAEPPKSLLPVADAYARRAIELDPNHPLGWSALAQAHVQWTRNWVGAEAGFRRALDLAPDTQSAASLLARLLAARHRPTEAVEQSLKALQLDRESSMLQTSAGIVHQLAGRSAEALPFFERALTLDPADATAAIWRSSTLAQMGRFEEASMAARQARESMHGAPIWVEGYVHALAGRVADARAVLQSLRAHAQRQYVPAAELAFLHLALGEQDAALTWLEEGIEERSRGMDLLAVDPTVNPLRGHPRFRAILAALQLPEAR
jgi:DNA-binding winged helix-turn-helix (wHTH) protein/tetratricopeptide (TPR) repeat protein